MSNREEFFRLKKIQGKKKRDTEEADAMEDAKVEDKAAGTKSNKEEKQENPDDGIGGGDAGGGDMLDQGKDKDVIF
jgi:V-type H+-transporting ATPase subunit D